MARITLVDRLHWRERPLAAMALLALVLVACAVSIMAAPGLPGWFGAGLALISIAIAVIDARFFIIPNELSAAAFVLALAHAAALAPDAIWGAVAAALIRAAVLGLLFYGMRALYQRIRGREGLGLGDVKLAAAIGAWLPAETVPFCFAVATAAALGFVLLSGLRGRAVARTTRIPFGAFLCPALWVVFFASLL